MKNSSYVEVIDTNTFRAYWLRKLTAVSENRNRLSELECIRLRKKIHGLLRLLDEIDERDVSKDFKAAQS
jgi:hypothetical protein